MTDLVRRVDIDGAAHVLSFGRSAEESSALRHHQGDDDENAKERVEPRDIETCL